ncbi:MAG: hypothetical protein IPK29_15230 [Betaproteobacteria bacterium]|nr:hypothetical protein [Betaproteobacteria bacterium]
MWNLLGTYTLAPGTAHRVTLTDEANGYVVADAIRLVAVNLTPAKQVYYIHPDHLNTPRLIADQNQTTVWRWDQQEPFGANLPEEDPDNDTKAFAFNLRFPGQYFDRETSLHYNYFRDYSPETGRYVQSDPIGLEGGINTYGYVRGHPTQNSDPTGESDVLMKNAMRAAGMPAPIPPSGVLDEECFVKCVVISKAALSIGSTMGINKAADHASGRIASTAAQTIRAVANNPVVMIVGGLYGLDFCYRDCRKDPNSCESVPSFQSTPFFHGAP